MISRTLLTGVVLGAVAVGLGACGGSGEDDATLGATRTFERAIDGDRPQRACELMTPRAAAQLAAAVEADDCAQALSGRDLDFERHSAAEFAEASVETDGDRVVVGIGDLGDRIGLRKVGGAWLVDNIVNLLEGRPERPDPRLAKGSDVQQVVATVNAQTAALDQRDHERACALYSPRAEAQFVIGLSFNLSFRNGKLSQPITCAAALRRLAKLTGEEDPFEQPGSLVGEIDAAQVSIRGDHATVEFDGFDALKLIRQDGRWLVDGGMSSYSEAEHTPVSALERCWRRAGAAIASDAGDLRFARAAPVRDGSDSFDHVSVKGDDWRIFYARPTDGRRMLYARNAMGEDPGFAKVLAKPDSVRAVAYVKHAPAHAGIVAKARACGD